MLPSLREQAQTYSPFLPSISAPAVVLQVQLIAHDAGVHYEEPETQDASRSPSPAALQGAIEAGLGDALGSRSASTTKCRRQGP